jgi:hypothetical protein
MVPLVMSAAELQLVAYGEKIEGAEYADIADVEEEPLSPKRRQAPCPRPSAL